MITVIADDLSGAAEMGGAALQAGLTAEIALLPLSTRNPQPSTLKGTADVLIVDTDSRSCSPREAAERVAMAWQNLASGTRKWSYKKIDSVLRGNVLAETRRLMEVGGFRRALLIPANPRRGRTIAKGCCYIDQQPLDQTLFASDPEYPARHHQVLDLLGADSRLDCHVMPDPSKLTADGIVIPDILSPADLHIWAERVDADTLTVGAAEFFEALLEVRAQERRPPAAQEPPKDPGPQLFVCGSPTAWRVMRRQQCEQRGIQVAAVEADTSVDRIAELRDDVAGWLRREGRAMIALSDQRPGTPQELLAPCIDLAREVLATTAVTRCLIEGGATASALLRGLQLSRLTIQFQYCPGVVGVRAASTTTEFIIKPGSYDWPEALWPEARGPDKP